MYSPDFWLKRAQGRHIGPPPAQLQRHLAVTLSDTPTECVRLPLVPVIVIGYVPVGVLLLVATVKAEVEELGDVTVTGLGLNAQVLSGGQPLTVRLTIPLKVFTGVKVTVYVAV